MRPPDRQSMRRLEPQFFNPFHNQATLICRYALLSPISTNKKNLVVARLAPVTPQNALLSSVIPHSNQR
jgi:hypothetical protein